MNTAKCVSCRATQLASDIDLATGNGPCCPTSKRAPRSDKGKTRNAPEPEKAGEKE